MPPNYEKKLNLLGQAWDVEYVTGWVKDEGEELLGCSHGHDRKITISLGQSAGSLLDTFLHEVIHSYWRMLPGLTEGMNISGNADEVEEQLVIAHTTMMLDLLKNNEWVRKLLL